MTEAKSEARPFRWSLIFIHNHRHEPNIARLNKLFGERFQSIQHLVPFYRGTAKDVIPVYDSSYRFQNFFAQGLPRFFKEDSTHYLFCADDLIINPRLNESNLGAELGLDSSSGFIKYLSPISTMPFKWPYTSWALSALAGNNGTNWKIELPDEAVARDRLKALGLEVKELSMRQFRYGIRPKQCLHLLNYMVKRVMKGARSWKELVHPPYPLIGGYADFMIVPAPAIKDFCHYCGVFAATSVFVEFGAPTAFALSCPQIVYEADLKWKGIEHWGKAIDNFGRSRNYSLATLHEHFPSEQLYVHPIKLSKWN